MKVVFDGRAIADHYPGIGRYAFGLARALGEVSDLALVVDPEAVNTRHDLRTIAARQVRVAGGPAALAAQWRVPAAVAATGAEVYHSPHYLMPYAISALVGRVRPVVTFYDLIPLLPEARYAPGARLAYRLAHWLAARVSRRVIVLSEWTRRAIVRAFALDPDSVDVIVPGVEAAFRPSAAAEVEALRARLGLPDTYLLYVGTNRPHKNLARLVQACGEVPRAAPILIVAGRLDSRFAESQSAIERLGLDARVRFLGPVAEADLPALYSGAELVVVPSLAEGFGLPVLEAMACGAPVACSTAPGLNEAAGEAAARFDPLDPAAIAAEIAALLGDEGRRQDLRHRGIDRAASFTWRRAAAGTLAAYEATR